MNEGRKEGRMDGRKEETTKWGRKGTGREFIQYYIYPISYYY